jgi:hypothetical protein
MPVKRITLAVTAARKDSKPSKDSKARPGH